MSNGIIQLRIFKNKKLINLKTCEILRKKKLKHVKLKYLFIT